MTERKCERERCGATLPEQGRGPPRRYCSKRCLQAVLKKRYLARRKAGVPLLPRTGPRVDHSGEVHGDQVVVRRVESPDNRQRYLVRCACGNERVLIRASVRCGVWDVGACDQCTASAAARVPGATKGVCSWCGAPSMSTTRPRGGAAYECFACNRAAQPSRGGRDETGRPMGKLRTADRTCGLCGEPLARRRVRYCSAECAKAVVLVRDRIRHQECEA